VPKAEGPIDVQTHFLPSAMVEVLESRDQRPRIVKGGERRLVEYGEGAVYPLVEEMVSIDRKLEHMDEAGLGMSVLSLNIPGLDGLDAADAASIARDVNAEMAALAASHPERLSSVAALPMQAPDQAAAELERAIGDGMKGAILYSNAGGRSLDEPEFRQVFDAAAALDAPMLMHPTYPLSASSLQAYALVPVIGFLFDTTTATLRLILDGLYRRHPDFKLIVGHAGGVIPYIVGRIDYESSRIPGGLGSLEGLPSEDIKKLYVDTVTAWPPSLSLAVDYLGTDRVLYATDHPFWDPARTRDALAEVELSEADREAIEVGNAQRLLGI
jgi:aminocarboxymuconate-semialdehyde decarboxylase